MGDRWPLPADYMEPGRVDYSEIDPGIRDAVRALNKIPFVETVASCEGHILKRHYGHRADPGFAFLDGGYIGMYVDGTDKNSAAFLGDMAGVARKYHFANFGKIYRRGAPGTGAPYVLAANTAIMSGLMFDLGEHDRVRMDDAEEAMCKKSRQAEISLVRGRKAEYQMLWADAVGVAAKHAAVD
jgi:hypothetical protein